MAVGRRGEERVVLLGGGGCCGAGGRGGSAATPALAPALAFYRTCGLGRAGRRPVYCAPGELRGPRRGPSSPHQRPSRGRSQGLLLADGRRRVSSVVDGSHGAQMGGERGETCEVVGWRGWPRSWRRGGRKETSSPAQLPQSRTRPSRRPGCWTDRRLGWRSGSAEGRISSPSMLSAVCEVPSQEVDEPRRAAAAGREAGRCDRRARAEKNTKGGTRVTLLVGVLHAVRALQIAPALLNQPASLYQPLFPSQHPNRPPLQAPASSAVPTPLQARPPLTSQHRRPSDDHPAYLPRPVSPALHPPPRGKPSLSSSSPAHPPA